MSFREALAKAFNLHFVNTLSCRFFSLRYNYSLRPRNVTNNINFPSGVMPNVPLMIATFAYLNQQRLTNETMIIDVRVCPSHLLALISPLTLAFRHLKKSISAQLTPIGGPTYHCPSFARLLHLMRRTSRSSIRLAYPGYLPTKVLINNRLGNLAYLMMWFFNVDQVWPLS